MRVVSVVEARRSLTVSSQEGVKLPLIAGAFGKAYLSAMSEGEMLELLQMTGLPRFTEKSIQHVGIFLDEVKKAKKLGFAPDLDEFMEGVTALAAPITSGDQPVGAVWLAGFTAALRNWNLFIVVRSLKETAKNISTAIGSPPGYYGSAASEGSNGRLTRSLSADAGNPPHAQSQQGSGT